MFYDFHHNFQNKWTRTGKTLTSAFRVHHGRIDHSKPVGGPPSELSSRRSRDNDKRPGTNFFFSSAEIRGLTTKDFTASFVLQRSPLLNYGLQLWSLLWTQLSYKIYYCSQNIYTKIVERQLYPCVVGNYSWTSPANKFHLHV